MTVRITGNHRGFGPGLIILFAVFALAGSSRIAQSIEASDYATSKGCEECHPEIYRQWKMSSHARMLRDAKKDPSAILADNFSEDIPFTKKDIEFALGSHWIQKYLTTIEGEMYILPRFWNIAKGQWEPYSIWNWRSRPYTHHCNWCHSVGYDPEAKSYVEASIGCEACHGPGKKHAESGEAEEIINPAKLTKRKADMICEACHTDGKDRASKTYPFPDGYRAGEDLMEYYTDFFMPKPGSQGWYKGESTYEERHKMFLFWQSRFYSTSRSCEVCEFDRGSGGGIGKKTEDRNMSGEEYCGTCHADIYKDTRAHSKHSPEQAQCVDCHVPLVVSSKQRYSIHDHKFDFSGPETPCVDCHGEETPEAEEGHSHEFYRFGPVRTKENLTVEQACERCHPESGPG